MILGPKRIDGHGPLKDLLKLVGYELHLTIIYKRVYHREVHGSFILSIGYSSIQR